MYGAKALDLIIDVPIGTLVYNEQREIIADLNAKDMEIIMAKGGKGGHGNSKFSSSVNRTPRYSQSGLPGETLKVFLELRLIAEVGIIGVPNSGKSSLLKAITKANPKIGDYAFTTLFPNLGTLKTLDKEVILADIPGLISGASQGEGLGFDFLRHIDRTKILVHLVQSHASEEDSWLDYMTIIDELKKKGIDNCRLEGRDSNEWKLIDAKDIIIHIFHPEKRKFYDLEKMWSELIPKQRLSI